jgi:hypothetical protein
LYTFRRTNLRQDTAGNAGEGSLGKVNLRRWPGLEKLVGASVADSLGDSGLMDGVDHFLLFSRRDNTI